MRFSPLVLLSTLLHAYIGWRIIPAWSGLPLAQGLIAALLVASAVLMPGGVFSRRSQAGRWTVLRTWAGLLFMGLFSSLFVFTLLRDLVLAAAQLWQAVASPWAGFD